ncbi:ester cyclase [Natrinema sp. 74]|uniref:ester cyclase n=1 Tax=Natrinema sp. 74 TaxID=3384159 RepID=UPI0038D4EF6C
MSTQEDTETIARRIFEEIWQNHDYDVIDELIAEEYVLHDPSMPEAAEQPTGRDGYRQMAEMGAEIIDGSLEIEQIVPAGDHVVVRWKQTGTHVGEMEGIEPTNEEVTVTGIEIDRFEDGQLVETWQEVGMLPMLTKIGVISEDLFSPEAS